MRKLVAALLFAVVPITATSLVVPVSATYAATASELGDLRAMSAIVGDTLTTARTGDLKAAERRITDFETAWDQAAGTIQPLSPTMWGAVDVAADKAISGLRAASPNTTEVEAALTGLMAELDNPGAGVVTEPAAAPSGAGAFAVTNADGSPLPCEVALKTVRDAAASKQPSDQAGYDTAMNKGLERCNADDDKRADGFFATAFGLLQ